MAVVVVVVVVDRDVSDNQFSGVFPASIFTFPKLKYMFERNEIFLYEHVVMLKKKMNCIDQKEMKKNAFMLSFPILMIQRFGYEFLHWCTSSCTSKPLVLVCWISFSFTLYIVFFLSMVQENYIFQSSSRKNSYAVAYFTFAFVIWTDLSSTITFSETFQKLIPINSIICMNNFCFSYSSDSLFFYECFLLYFWSQRYVVKKFETVLSLNFSFTASPLYTPSPPKKEKN